MATSEAGKPEPRDPLGDFLSLYDSSGEAPANWMEQWAAGGPDPWIEAWGRSISPFFMRNLVHRIMPEHAAAMQDAMDRSNADPTHPTHPDNSDCPHCAAAIRAALPPPPALEEVLAKCLSDDVRRRWAECTWPGELINLAGRAGADRRKIVLVICELVRRASELVPAELRSLNGLAAAERWTQGEDSKEDLEAAVSADAAACHELSGRRFSMSAGGPEGGQMAWPEKCLPPQRDRPLRMAARLASASRFAGASAHMVGFEDQAPYVMGERAVDEAVEVVATAATPIDVAEEAAALRQTVDAACVESANIIRARIGDLPDEHPQLARYRRRAAEQRNENWHTP